MTLFESVLFFQRSADTHCRTFFLFFPLSVIESLVIEPGERVMFLFRVQSPSLWYVALGRGTRHLAKLCLLGSFPVSTVSFVLCRVECTKGGFSLSFFSYAVA